MRLRVRATAVAWLVALACVLTASLTPNTAGVRHTGTAAAAALPATATADAGLPASTVTAGTPTTAPASPTAAPTATGSPILDIIPTPVPGSPTPVPTNPTSPLTPTTDSTIPPLAGGTQNALPLEFDPNAGQSAPDVAYVAHAGASTLFFTPQEADLALPLSATTSLTGTLDPAAMTDTGALSVTLLRLGFGGAAPSVVGTDPSGAIANYIDGSDPSRWHTGLATYDALSAQHVAPGIDLVYSGTVAGQLEASYQVAPGANPSQIALTLGGADGVSLDGAGNLVLQTAAGPVTLSAPVAYQTINGQQAPVDVAYALPPVGIASPTAPAASSTAADTATAASPTAADTATAASTTTVSASPAASATTVSTTPVPTMLAATATATPTLPATTTLGLVVGAYDPTQPLTIDPVLSWSTYLSGSQNDRARAVALDQQGNIYLTGNTASADFPTSSGAYTSTFSGGGNDAYVVKLSPDGKTRQYSTYLGGTGDDYGTDIAVNSSGNAYITGWTWSRDFPTTANAAQPAPGSPGLDDAYLSELSPDGTRLVYSSYLGGSGYDVGNGLALGQEHLVYVGGVNYGGGLPTTTTAYQQSYQGGDASQPSDGFLLAVDTSLSGASGLVYASYFGGSGNDAITGLAADAHGHVYIAGSTDSSNFPISTTLQSAYGGGSSDAFVATLTPALSGAAGLAYSSYLGGSGADQATGIASDDSGAYVTGQTASPDFPTVNAVQPAYGGGASDAFVSRVNANGTSLAYSTFLGGSGDDYGNAITTGGPGGVNVTGQTGSTNFLTTTDALQPAKDATVSAFVTQLNAQFGGSASLLYSSYLGGTNGESVGSGIAADGQGNAVVAGFTHATDLQGTGGTAQPSPVPNGGEDGFVTKLVATPDCPTGFDCADIGSPALGGDQLLSGSRAKGTWTVQDAGSGTGDGYTSDQFHDVAMDALGDGSISARIVTQTNTSGAAKSGLMYRASEDPTAPYYDVVAKPYNTGSAVLLVQHRDTPGGAVVTTASAPTTLPVYVRMTRAITSFTSYTSSDGVHWSALANSTDRIDVLSNTIQAGLMAAAYNTAMTTTATFDSVTINTCPTGWNCDDIGSPATAGDQAPLGDQFVSGAAPFFLVQGAGTGLPTGSGATADQFHYMHTTFGSDGSASARLTDLRAADGSTDDPSAAAGVMLRQTTDPGAPYYFVGLTAGNGLVVQDRAITGTAATSLVQTAGITTPLYLRADRVGTAFKAYTSTDSVNWTLLANSSVTIGNLGGDIEQGLAVTSHQSAVATAGTFDYVRMDACPDTWACVGVNSPPQTGTEYYSNGVWSLRGVGAGQHQYVWQAANGDSGLSARLTGQVDTEANAQAGLMYRGLYNGGNGGAPFYLIATEPNHGLLVAARTTDNGSNVTLATSQTATLPLYLQVVRSGDTFTAYTSPDDASWAALPGSSVAIDALTDTAELGLFVNSGDATSASTALFDSTAITGTVITPSTMPSGGQDLVNLDTHTEHYTQSPEGLVHLQVYNSPVGIPDLSGWQQRDTSLSIVTSTGAITPNNVPFTETIAPDTTGITPTGNTASNGPTMASLTNEDGVTLSVGLTSTTPLTSGVVAGNAVTYTGALTSNTTPAPPSSDLSLRSTTSGIDARVVIHSASERGPFLMNLNADLAAQFAQDADGTIHVTHNITGYADDGITPYTTTQTEYTVQSPILVDSSSAVTAPVSTGPTTVTLASNGGGGQTVSVSVDPTWMNDPHRTFPVQLDLPIVTVYSDANTQLFGTTNSCAPNMIAPQTEVVVGSINGCTYHGQEYFDLSSLPDDTSILTATLRMYTPSQMTATGVQVYENAPLSAGNDPATTPSWNTAPIVMTGTTGLAQTASDGHWQSWDVTGLVQGWVQDDATNTGMTLIGGGTPMRFASPLGAGIDLPAMAPYLDITYSTPASKSPAGGGAYYDGAKNIYGVSGSFTTRQGKRAKCPPSQVACNGNMAVQAIAAKNNGLDGALMRVSVLLNCSDNYPDGSYWQSAAFGNSDTIGNMLTEAFDSNVIPIVNFVIPNGPNGAARPDCVNLLGNPIPGGAYYDSWRNEMKSFVHYVLVPAINTADLVGFPGVPSSAFPHFVHFEIGNEQNLYAQAFFGDATVQPNNYSLIFAAAAAGLRQQIAAEPALAALRYRVLTAGMANPRGRFLTPKGLR